MGILDAASDAADVKCRGNPTTPLLLQAAILGVVTSLRRAGLTA